MAKQKKVKLHGVVPVIPIPFRKNESIDVPSLKRVVDFVAQKNMAGMCLPAYGSEFYKLSEAERIQVVEVAIDANKKRIPVMAQANHPSAKHAADLAKRYQRMGADIISFAIPRQFAIDEPDVLRYCCKICDAVSIPVLIQDFNPGGGTIDADFIATLHRRHRNFLFAKLEEPMIVDKLVRIIDQVGKKVSILEGWGGYYMLEAIPNGICGIMPGVPYCELLDIIYKAREAGDNDRAYDLFASVAPIMNYTLQNFELFLQVEKRMLVKRGIFKTAQMRDLTLTPSAPNLEYVDLLINQLQRIYKREGVAFS
jgi:4-hydroxy-tetrahydrodipicolinate synthase